MRSNSNEQKQDQFVIRNRLQTLLFMRHKASVRERTKIDREVLNLRSQLKKVMS